MKKLSFVIISIIFLFASCSDVSDLLDNYNSSFSASSESTVRTETASMLQAQYYVDYEYSFGVYAPSGCKSYKWGIEGVTFSDDVDLESRYFHFYIPNTSLVKGHVYTLTLSVVDAYDAVVEETSDLYVFSRDSD